MASDLKPETVRKKLLATETLPQFLARMTLVWEERQRRLAEAPARAVEAVRRHLAKLDPEVRKARQLAAQRRYAERHPDRIKAKDKARRDRLGAALAVAKAITRAEKQALRDADRERKAAERGAKRANRPEGYPKDQPKRRGGLDAAHVAAVACQPDLSRVWFGPVQAQAARPERRSSLASD